MPIDLPGTIQSISASSAVRLHNSLPPLPGSTPIDDSESNGYGMLDTSDLGEVTDSGCCRGLLLEAGVADVTNPLLVDAWGG